MAIQIRPSKKLAKIAYDILKTPKELQQKNKERPSEKERQAWKVDSMSVV